MPLTSIYDTFQGYHPANPDWQGEGNLNYIGQSISLTSKFDSISFEELRLNDYESLNPSSSIGRHGYDTQLAQTRADVAAASALQQGLSSIVKFSFNPMLLPTPLQTSRLRPRSNLYGSSTLTFRVGNEPSRDFSVHEKLITANSDFVAMTVKPEWKETTDRVIPLPADEPETFEIYQIWLYERSICTPSSDGKPNNEKDFPLLASAYIFADKMLDFDFRDAIIDCIIEQIRCTGTFDVSLIENFYCKTLPNSPLRRLLCHLYASVGSRQWLDQMQPNSEVQAEFMKDVLTHQLASNSAVGQNNNIVLPPFLGNTCVYHQHPRGVCYKKTKQ